MRIRQSLKLAKSGERGDIPKSDFTFPPLATIHVHKVLLGEIAAERLARRLENPVEVYPKVTTPTELVVRQSCGARLQV